MKCTFTSRQRRARKRPQYSQSRDWLSALAGLLLLVSTTSALAASRPPRFDRFGGLRTLKAKPSGWFRIGRFGNRDLFVSPDGHGYIALGVNHIGAVAQGGPTALFSAHTNRDWDRYFAEVLKPQLNAWNMNSLGYGAPAELFDRMPFFATITLAPIEKHRSHPIRGQSGAYQFPDVFDPAWQREVENRIHKACDRYRDNHFLIGYFWTDTPTWDLVKTRGLRGTDWVSAIRQLPNTAPGKQRYASFLRDRYVDRLDELNTIYGLPLRSVEEVVDHDFKHVAIGRHVVREDDEAFLEQIARCFYEVVGTAQRRFDPNHLVLGDRYLAGDAPASVLRAASPWIDVVSVQPGDRYTKLYPPSTYFPERMIEHLHRVTGKPVLICDHAISYPTRDEPRTIFEQMPSQAEAARATDAFLRQALSKPYMLGYLRCQYIDRPAGFGRGLRQGLVDQHGKPRQLLVNTYRHVFSEMLKGLETGEMTRLCENGLGRAIEIEFWYGDEQRFGLLGHPQRWVNILGHVSPGVEINALSYSLNGAESKPLSFREDFKRLARTGDFNVEIDRCLLKSGENKIVLRATTRTGQTAERGMTVFYVDDGRRWPLPYRIDWSQTPRIEEVAQVVDGKWKLTQRGVRSVEPYYDRVLAIGDSSWRDYEVSTTVTFHRFTPPHTSPNTTGVTHAAIATRWPGHDADGQQPSVKWYPLGATAEFRLTWNLDECRWRIFDGKRPFHVESQRRRAIELEKTYRMKHRVETIDDVRSRYRVKLWPVGETEPDAWDLERHESGDLENGSALLLTHHADATFGNITVLPCGQARSQSARF